MSGISGIYLGSARRDEICFELESIFPYDSETIFSLNKIEHTYINTLAQEYKVTISTFNPLHVINGGGAYFSIQNTDSQPRTIHVEIEFDKDFTGIIELNIQSFDNQPPINVDTLFDFNIGSPTNSSPNTIISNASVMSTPLDTFQKTLSWEDLDKIRKIKFKINTVSGGLIAFSLTLKERKIRTWSYDGIYYTDLETNNRYNTLPTGANIINCNEKSNKINDNIVLWSENICSKFDGQVYLCIGAGTFVSSDPFGREMSTGTPININVPGYQPNFPVKISTTGDNIYYVNTYTTTLTRSTIDSITGYTSVNLTRPGIMAHTLSDISGSIIRDIALDPTDNDRLYALVVGSNNSYHLGIQPLENIFSQDELIGDIGIPSMYTASIDFTASGDLLLVTENTIYIVDKYTGKILKSREIVIPAIGKNIIQKIGRLSTGDLLITSESLSGERSMVIIDSDSFEAKSFWGNSHAIYPSYYTTLTNPSSSKSKLIRVFEKDVITNTITTSNYDINGKFVLPPINNKIIDCEDNIYNMWSESYCTYEHIYPKRGADLLFSRSSGSIYTNSKANEIGIFSVGSGYISSTYSKDGKYLYGLYPGTGGFDIYDWGNKASPTLLTPALGYLNLLPFETPFLIRTRWSDGSIWISTSQYDGVRNIYKFYTLDIALRKLIPHGIFTLEAPSPMIISFTWGVDDQMYAIWQDGIFTKSYVYKLDTSTYEFSIHSLFKEFDLSNNSGINTDITSGALIISIYQISNNNSEIDWIDLNGKIFRVANFSDNIESAMSVPYSGFEYNKTTKAIDRLFIQEMDSNVVTHRDVYAGTGIRKSVNDGIHVFKCEELDIISTGSVCITGAESLPSGAFTRNYLPLINIITGINHTDAAPFSSGTPFPLYYSLPDMTGSGGNVSLYDVEVSNTSSIGLWQFGGTGLLNIYDAKISNASNLFVTDESWGIVLSNIIINNQGELNISNTYNAASDINIRNININSDSNFTIYNSALTTYGTSTIENVSLDTGSSLQIMDATNNMDIRYINCATHGVLSVISSAISTNNVSLINSEVTQSDGSIDTLFASMNSLLNINHSVTECYYNYPGSFTTSGININKGRDYFNNTWV